MSLARRVGLGFASRGKVSDCVAWAERARGAGIESVWFHDSYFERDAVTYASAVASQVEEIGVGLGALNPFTRHPVLIAMTVSALDEMAPSRIRLGLGSALPLRLGQMGIPYVPEDAATRTVTTIDTLHAEETNVAHRADDRQIAVGRAVVDLVSARFGTPMYARVDLVRGAPAGTSAG